MRIFRLFTFCLLLSSFACQQSYVPTLENINYVDAIRLNQVGYYPNAPKKAIIAQQTDLQDFTVYDLRSKKKVFAGALSAPKDWPIAGETVRVADFSKLKKEGLYTLHIKGIGYAHPFEIRPAVLQDALQSSMKSYYFQRLSMPLEEQFAGQWQRAAGHPDNAVIFHPSTGQTGTTRSPGGWYDAGDFGKYVVNGSFSLGQMLFLYEQYPDAIKDGSLNLPESGNGVSDLLDELKYEMDWLLTMQDADGGLFFKLTTKGFSGMIMPERAKKERYIIGKSTTASLDFAAVAAKMARAFREIDDAYADRCLNAAQRAWNWSVANPDIAFTNPKDVKTGEYPDKKMADEFFWAAAELYIATKDEQYKRYLVDTDFDFSFKEGESWANFPLFLGAFTLINHLESAPWVQPYREAIKESANQLVAQIKRNDYFQAVDDFQWGSNSDVLNAAMILAQAYRMEPQPKFLSAIQETTDYIFGKNALGVCFLTGFGERSPMHLHHRQSEADGIEAPIPGFLSGGPNFNKQDKNNVPYPENAPPMRCWVDVKESYASNEVCLNWNSALVYVLGFLEAELSE